MADIKWTPSQRAAIETRGRNILVSAAAGSGKTAVLVERIISRVMKDFDKTDIDRMLVVTFTNAAAAEMKEKINKRLRNYKRAYRQSEKSAIGGRIKFSARFDCRKNLKIRREEEKRRLYDQIGALDDADICTIDSFCKKCVQSFAHELDIAPDFKLYDPAEDDLAIEAAASKLIDEYYKNGDERFMRLSEYYSSMRDDRGLKEIVMRIYKFLQSYAEPMDKLDEIFKAYGNDANEDLFESEWAKELMKTQSLKAKRMISRLWKNESAAAWILTGIIFAAENVDFNTEGEEWEKLSLISAAALAGEEELMRERVSENIGTLSRFCDENGHLGDAAADILSAVSNARIENKFAVLYAAFGRYAQALGMSAYGYFTNIARDFADPIIETAKLNTSKIKGETAWNNIYNFSQRFAGAAARKPAKSKKRSDFEQGLIDRLEEVKKYLKEFSFDYIEQSTDEVKSQYEYVSARADDLKAVVKELAQKVEGTKRDKNMYSFADIEHMAYKLVTDPRYEDIAAIYRERYSDILIDEYQDTNGLQDAIFAGISNGKNIFMVGDLKQSIYAFRGGDPSIFKKKGALYTAYDKAAKMGDDPVRIDLADNFRSCESVVNGVNSLFEYIMTDDLGDVDYNKKGEKLVCARAGNDSEEQKETYRGQKSEIAYIKIDKNRGEREIINGEETNKLDIEARYVADRIRKMVDSKMKIAVGKGVREVTYSDFTILAGSVKSIINVYSDALEERGIPLAVPSIGYYDFFEVSVVLSYLKIMANRRRDVPLVTVMRSPIGGFGDEELARIALSAEGGDFYEKLCAIVREQKNASESALVKKIKKFLNLLDRFDSYKHYKSVAAIVYSIYTETGFYDFVGAMDGGKTAQRNLTLLYEKAKKFETGGAGSLYGFVKYIEKLREEKDDESGAGVTQSDAVNMMTIHASKGLEFPIVFLVSCGKRFPPEENTDGIINREAGIGLKYFDKDNKTSIASPVFKWVKLRNKKEIRSEDVRKLYVGVTRAREKLVCVMTSADDNTADEKNGAELATDTKGAAMELIDAAGFSRWIMPAYFAEKAAAKNKKNGVWKLISDIDVSEYTAKDVYGIIKYRYGFDKLTLLPSKTTVSKIKEETNERENALSSAREGAFEAKYNIGLDKIPTYETEFEVGTVNKTSIPATVIGSAYHRLMELVNPLKCENEEQVRIQIKEFCDAGLLNAEAARKINVKAPIRFFHNHELGKKAAMSYSFGRLHRETPFETEITPDEYTDTITPDEYQASDRILLQGTIDCWFEDENGDCYIIDYKTDRYRGNFYSEEEKLRFAEQKVKEYRIQLDLYAKALEKALDDGTRINATIKGKYLYLFDIDRFVKAD